MKVDIILSEENIDPADVYLEGMKGYPNPKCQPTIRDHVAQFQLPLRDFFECGVTRIVYKPNVRVNFHLEQKSAKSPSSHTLLMRFHSFAGQKSLLSQSDNWNTNQQRVCECEVLNIGAVQFDEDTAQLDAPWCVARRIRGANVCISQWHSEKCANDAIIQIAAI